MKLTKRECDLVMKGGIMSGVVYARLAQRLAECYVFRRIGGTSAGAIAASLTAAAQLGSTSGARPDALRMLGTIPEQLAARSPRGSGTRLLDLVQAYPQLQGHFAVLLELARPGTVVRRLACTAQRLLVHFWLGAMLGGLPGLLLLIQGQGGRLPLALSLVALGATIGAVLQATYRLVVVLPTTLFGLCSGMSEAGHPDAPAITPWLQAQLNELSGGIDTQPLTFGELWHGRRRGKDELLPDLPVERRVIDVAMITTALDHGRPYRLPFESRDLYFSPEELAAYFPSEIIDWMCRHARRSETARKLSAAVGRDILALPEPRDFPVVVAVRLSMAVPFLLSAVPLYTVDRTFPEHQGAAACPVKPTRICFSDGGLCSNFPIHFFDALLPTRPTFGVNLVPEIRSRNQARVWLPEMRTIDQAVAHHCPEMRETTGVRGLIGFVATIARTMQHWRDESQLAMPGFRDRIVDIRYAPDESGLTLALNGSSIRALADRGAAAADLLCKAFLARPDTDHPNAWDRHRRLRLRILLSEVQQAIREIDAALESPDGDYRRIAGDCRPASCLFPDVAARQAAVEVLDRLQNLVLLLGARRANLIDGAPQPEPELRIVPRL